MAETVAQEQHAGFKGQGQGQSAHSSWRSTAILWWNSGMAARLASDSWWASAAMRLLSAISLRTAAYISPSPGSLRSTQITSAPPWQQIIHMHAPRQILPRATVLCVTFCSACSHMLPSIRLLNDAARNASDITIRFSVRRGMFDRACAKHV